MKPRTRLDLLMKSTKTTSKDILRSVNINKTLLSKFKNSRKLKQSNKHYELIKSFFLLEKETELLDYFECDYNNLPTHYDGFFEQNDDLSIHSFLSKHSNSKILICLRSDFSNSSIYDDLKNVIKLISNNIMSIDFFIDRKNSKLTSFLLDNLTDSILFGNISIYLADNISDNFIFVNNKEFLSIHNYKNRIMIMQQTTSQSTNDYLNLVFNNYVKENLDVYLKTNIDSIHLLNKTISDKLYESDYPIYITTHPHFTSLSIELLDKFNLKKSSPSYSSLEKLVSIKDQKHNLVIASSIDNFLIKQDSYLSEGISLFTNQLAKLNNQDYSTYLDGLILAYKNDYINFNILNLNIPYNITLFKDYIIIYKYLSDSESNHVLFIDNRFIIANLKDIWLSRIRSNTLNKTETLKILEHARDINKTFGFDKNIIY